MANGFRGAVRSAVREELEPTKGARPLSFGHVPESMPAPESRVRREMETVLR